MKPKFYLEPFKNRKGMWHSRIMSANGNKIWTSEAYNSKAKCYKTMISFQEFLAENRVLFITD